MSKHVHSRLQTLAAIFALALLLAMGGCRKSARTVPPSTTFGSGRENPEIYQPLFNGERRPDGTRFESREDLDDWFSHLPYETITLERSPCYGTCPVYRVTLHRDGRAEFDAIQHLPVLGKFAGKLELSDYARLCYALDRLHFMAFEPSYTADWTDDFTVTITTIGDSGKKVVSEYGSTGPIELWTLQQAIDNVRQKIHWEKK